MIANANILTFLFLVLHFLVVRALCSANFEKKMNTLALFKCLKIIFELSNVKIIISRV